MFSGTDRSQEHSSLFPQDVDKLRREYSSQEELEGPGGPITAREAFALAEEIIQDFDDGARLVFLQSDGSLNPEGQSEGWLFEFVLPNRWGHASFRFRNSGSQETLSVKLTPFAPEGGGLDKMLQEGQSGFVEQQWKMEMGNQAYLSHSFRDSTDVLATWEADGKSINYKSPIVLRAVTPPLGKPRWELLESPSAKKSLYSLAIE